MTPQTIPSFQYLWAFRTTPPLGGHMHGLNVSLDVLLVLGGLRAEGADPAQVLISEHVPCYLGVQV